MDEVENLAKQSKRGGLRRNAWRGEESREEKVWDEREKFGRSRLEVVVESVRIVEIDLRDVP